MKTDRELLELAAMAAGINALNYCEEGMQLIAAGKLQYWNPLTDDGDALRLAVGLDMKVYVGEAYPFSKSTATYVLGACCDEDECPDPYAATRRAIVRAAAAIGEGMK